MAGEFLSVPGNVKQIFLPFVLDPNNAINNTPIDVAEDSGNKAGDKKTNTTAANAGGEKTKFET